MTKRNLYVPYYRVSTARQNTSGLGLSAQNDSVTRVVAAEGGEVVAEFTEVESGKRNNRPQLALAIATCKRLGATLIVARLDRLSRNVAFVSALLDSGVNFIACDNPNATRLTIHILAAFAEEERRLISERTKAALAAAKRRGVKLGCPDNLTAGVSKMGRVANTAAAKAHADTVRPVVASLNKRGYSLAAIAAELTARGILSRRGKAYSARTVLRLLA